ncbi:hypothetical protein D8I24_7166 [Cupriavidus necator H850]|nr:hypothetical protein D8I24_7166 [Cupriavidus necator H850]
MREPTATHGITASRRLTPAPSGQKSRAMDTPIWMHRAVPASQSLWAMRVAVTMAAVVLQEFRA